MTITVIVRVVQILEPASTALLKFFSKLENVNDVQQVNSPIQSGR
eukprot:COSAG01_NODE_40966_length_457_cov_1.150838_1_plen_44_part_10